MSDVGDALDSLLAAISDAGDEQELSLQPGATEAEIAEAEAAIGFELVPELRDLYRHANGVVGSLIGNDHHFAPLRASGSLDQRRLRFLDNVYMLDHSQDRFSPILHELDGAPSKPFLVCPGVFGFAVECGPVATGGVMFQTEEAGFQWVAPNLTEFFALLEQKIREGMKSDDPYWDFLSTVDPHGIAGETEAHWRWH